VRIKSVPQSGNPADHEKREPAVENRRRRQSRKNQLFAGKKSYYVIPYLKKGVPVSAGR